MFGNNRNQLRNVFYECWKLHREGKDLDPMQSIISGIIIQHPEYHPLLEDADNLEKDFDADGGESNPFLHMSMHIALHEQISTDRPKGISGCFRALASRMGSEHEAMHAMMECLGESLWTAQRNQTEPDEKSYLDCLKNL